MASIQSRRTRLVQVSTSSIYDAPQILTEESSNSQETVLVVVVEPPMTCCYPKLDVPSGVTTLGQKWGAHDGVMKPGAHCCFCTHKRIACAVTRGIK